MLVVIPYFSGGAQGNELSLAVKGWQKHCKTEFQMLIIGDKDPHLDYPNVKFEYCERVQPSEGNYTPHLDFVNKFKIARLMYPYEEGFVWATDDNYPVKDFDESWLKRLRYLTDKPFGAPRNGGWPLDKYFTICKLLDMDITARNYTTHLPCWFNFDRLMALFDVHDMDHSSYVIEDMYFNIYHRNDKAELCTPYQYFLNTHDSYIDLPAAIGQYMWICNTVDGWSTEMEKILQDYYNGESE